MRDAWSLLDQCLAFHFGHELTYDMVLDVLGAVDTSVFSKLLRCVIARDVAGCIGVLEEIVLQGRDMSQFVSDFTWYLRNLLLVKTSGDSCEEVIDISLAVTIGCCLWWKTGWRPIILPKNRQIRAHWNNCWRS